MISIRIKKLKSRNELNLPHTVAGIIEHTSDKYSKEDILRILKEIVRSDYTNTATFTYTTANNQTCKLYICPQYYPYGMIDLSCNDFYADISHKNPIGGINEIVSILSLSQLLLGETNKLIDELCHIVEESFSKQGYSSYDYGRYIVDKLKNCSIYIEFLTCLDDLKKDYIRYCIKNKIQRY